MRWSITSGHALLNWDANLFFLLREIAKCEPAARNAKGELRITDRVRMKTDKPAAKPTRKDR
jgi:hypothetical protein